MNVSVKFYSSAPSNNVTVQHYLNGFIFVLGKKIIVPLGHNSSKYGSLQATDNNFTILDATSYIDPYFYYN